MKITKEQLKSALISSTLFYYDKDYHRLQFGYMAGADFSEEIQQLLVILNNIKE